MRFFTPRDKKRVVILIVPQSFVSSRKESQFSNLLFPAELCLTLLNFLQNFSFRMLQPYIKVSTIKALWKKSFSCFLSLIGDWFLWFETRSKRIGQKRMQFTVVRDLNRCWLLLLYSIINFIHSFRMLFPSLIQNFVVDFSSFFTF